MHQNRSGFQTNIQPPRGTSGGLFVLGKLGLLNRNVYYNSDIKYEILNSKFIKLRYSSRLLKPSTVIEIAY